MLRTPYAVDQGCRIVRHTITAPGHMLVRSRQHKLAGIKTGGVRLRDVQHLQR